MFESFVNSKRYKTQIGRTVFPICLRALLIQKDTKLRLKFGFVGFRLRALLIQKDTKPNKAIREAHKSLRALLIQKDTKQLHRCTLLSAV